MKVSKREVILKTVTIGEKECPKGVKKPTIEYSYFGGFKHVYEYESEEIRDKEFRSIEKQIENNSLILSFTKYRKFTIIHP